MSDDWVYLFWVLVVIIPFIIIKKRKKKALKNNDLDESHKCVDCLYLKDTSSIFDKSYKCKIHKIEFNSFDDVLEYRCNNFYPNKQMQRAQKAGLTWDSEAYDRNQARHQAEMKEKKNHGLFTLNINTNNKSDENNDDN